MYIYVYENWRLYELHWNSSTTWIIAFIGVDFLYYWFHRAAHGENYLFKLMIFVCFLEKNSIEL